MTTGTSPGILPCSPEAAKQDWLTPGQCDSWTETPQSVYIPYPSFSRNHGQPPRSQFLFLSAASGEDARAESSREAGRPSLAFSPNAYCIQPGLPTGLARRTQQSSPGFPDGPPDPAVPFRRWGIWELEGEIAVPPGKYLFQAPST